MGNFFKNLWRNPAVREAAITIALELLVILAKTTASDRSQPK